MDSKKLSKCNFLCEELLLTENRPSDVRHLKKKTTRTEWGMFVYRSNTGGISNRWKNCSALGVRTARAPWTNADSVLNECTKRIPMETEPCADEHRTE